MKNKNLILLLIILLFTPAVKAQFKSTQPLPLTRDGLFDTVYDHLGNKYPLKNLLLNEGVLTGTTTGSGGRKLGSAQVNALPTQWCSAGKFDLYFQNGSYFANNSLAQTVICQLFTDISNFIISPPSNVRINILCDNTPTNMPNAMGTASSFYVFPLNPLNANQGIVDNQIYKALTTGHDPFLGLPFNVFPGANNFYYGYVNVNPNASWHLNMNTTSIASTDFDFYTVMLHEVLHALGFASLIDFNGFSQFGANNNYFTRYDEFLTDKNGTPLLSTSTPICPKNNLSFQGPTTKIAPGGACQPNVTNCLQAARYVSSSVNVKVYTPDCWEAGSSLSHFEDICSTPLGFIAPCSVTPPNNDMYYVMCNGVSSGNCFVKRYPRDEERQVLCDIGYKTQSNYSSPVAGTAKNYAGNCSPIQVFGRHDGLNGNSFQWTTTGSNIQLVPSQIVNNDYLNGANMQFKCLEPVYGNISSYSWSSNSGLNVVANQGAGLVVFKYLPYHTTSGTYGTATYIYMYFLPVGCSPTDPCTIVQNGGFESTTSPTPWQCSWFYRPSLPTDGVKVSCWDMYDLNDPDAFTRGCTSNGNIFNLGTNTYGTIPTINSYIPNMPGNDRVIGLGGWIKTNPPSHLSEGIKNSLGSPLQTGQTYEVSFWVYHASGTYNLGPFHGNKTGSYNNANKPVVITVCSAPNFAVMGIEYPNTNLNPNLNPVAEFTVPVNTNGQWSYVSQQFLFNPASGGSHSALLVGPNMVKTIANGGFFNESYYFFIDDVKVTALPAPTFSIPPTANPCGGGPIMNLAQFASSIPGVFAGNGVSQSGSQFNFNSPPTLPPGTYPISFSFTKNGCAQTLWQNVVVAPPIPITVTGPAPYCNYPKSVKSNVTIGASAGQSPVPGQTFTWTAPTMVGPNQTFLAPIATKVYTVQAMFPTCIAQETLEIKVLNNCCPPMAVANVINSGVITAGTTLSGVNVINQSAVITGPPNTTHFLNGEFILAPGVKITVPLGHQMEMQGAHFYSCLDMWQGIEVLDGAQIYNLTNTGQSNPSTLIEDAMYAIDLSTITQNHWSPPIQLEEVIFNRNLVGIRINNGSVPTLPLDIRSCIFTCRNIPASGLTWPGASTIAADLRSTSTGTVTLASPYDLGTHPLTNLKQPLPLMHSYAGVYITDINNIPGIPATPGVDIGMTYLNTGADFNLFDGMNYGYYVANAGLTTVANVFQNMRAQGGIGGIGVRHEVNTQMNARLDLSPVMNNFDVYGMGNYFWNCYKGVEATNVYEIDIERAVFRSTQQVGTAGQYQQGSFGITASTNRLTYNIRLNQFNNIADGITIRTIPGPYFIGQPQAGVFGGPSTISDNYFGPALSSLSNITNEFVDNAISIEGPNQAGTQIAGSMRMTSNKIDRAFRGISIKGMDFYPIDASGNKVLLADDIAFGNRQYGVQVIGTHGNISVIENTLSCTGPANQNAALVYCEENHSALSPLLKCNRLDQCFTGFEFNGSNAGTIWNSNEMQNLERGMSLTNYAIIAQQGTPGTPADNVWLGNTWNGPGYHTWVDMWTNAGSSPLYLTPGSTTWPSVNGGPGINYNTPGYLHNSQGGTNLCTLFGSYPTVPSYKEVATGLEEGIAGLSTMVIYPNPTTGKLYIRSVTESDHLKVRVQDVTGKLLLENTFNTENYLSEFDLPFDAGVYFINIEDSNGTSSGCRKLVISR